MGIRLEKYSNTSNYDLYEDAIRDILEQTNVLTDKLHSTSSDTIKNLSKALKDLECAKSHYTDTDDNGEWRNTYSGILKTINNINMHMHCWLKYHYKVEHGEDKYVDKVKEHLKKLMEEHNKISNMVKSFSATNEEKGIITSYIGSNFK